MTSHDSSRVGHPARAPSVARATSTSNVDADGCARVEYLRIRNALLYHGVRGVGAHDTADAVLGRIASLGLNETDVGVMAYQAPRPLPGYGYLAASRRHRERLGLSHYNEWADRSHVLLSTQAAAWRRPPAAPS